MRTRTSSQKRQKEIARMEKQREKTARRMQRKLEPKLEPKQPSEFDVDSPTYESDTPETEQGGETE